MGTGKETGNLGEEIKKIRQALKDQELKAEQLAQLTYLNKELLQKLKATEKSNRSLMRYINEIHKSLRDNFNRTPIEEIWFRELGNYLKKFK